LVLDGGDGTFSQPGPAGGDGFSILESGEVSLDDFFRGGEGSSVEGTEFFVGEVSEGTEGEGGGVTSSVPVLDDNPVGSEDTESDFISLGTRCKS